MDRPRRKYYWGVKDVSLACHHTQLEEEERRHTMRIDSASCEMIRDLGFTASVHITMYGERFEIISEPFDEGDCVAVRATSGNDPEVRILRLPTAILVGPADRFPKEISLTAKSAA